MMIGRFKVGFGMSFTYPCPRKLREIMKMSMIEREPVHKVSEIWHEYHHPRINNTSATLDKEKHHLLYQRAGSSPYFLIPVRRPGGHFKLLTQWQKDCFLCTFLEDFKRQGTKAHPYVVFTLFPQLLFKKAIVLVRGDIISHQLTKPEAEGVWQEIEKSYTQQGRFQLVHNFNNQPNQFNQQSYNQAFRL